jgi:hypothetical protein
MKRLGIKTIRYTNIEIDRQFDAVCDDIDEKIIPSQRHRVKRE